MSTTYQQGSLDKVVMIRLQPGKDLIEGITEVCMAQEIKSGAVTSCIGSLRRASFFTVVPLPTKMGAGYSDPIEMEGPLELVSAQGTIGLDVEGNLLIHMHGVLGDGRGNLFGSHLIKGKCPILITGEVMIAVFKEIRAVQQYDPETEMKLLTFVRNE